MQAIILSIGDELVLGQTVDTNSSYLSAKLAKHGIGTRYHLTVADDQTLIADAICQAVSQTHLLIITGGLGPTDDDLTRQGLADAMDEPLVLHQPSIEQIRSFFAKLDRPMPKRNTIQAMHPRGTTVIPNTCGTAPGIKAVLNNTTIYVIPGVPREMCVMFNQAIQSELGAVVPSRHVILTTTVNTFGLGESDVAERLGPLMDRDHNPKLGTTVANSCVCVRVRSEFPDRTEAHHQLEATVELVKSCLGPVVFGRDDELIQHALVCLLQQQHQSLATAESCTGGWLGKLITDVPGSSLVYRGGWVTYTNDLKMSQLGVPKALLKSHGAVSLPVARCMATTALQRADADLGAAITGIAGPDGGSHDKPVGTIWIALAHRSLAASEGIDSQGVLLRYAGDREHIRDRAAKAALQMVRLHLLGQPINPTQASKDNPRPEMSHGDGFQSRHDGQST